MTRQQKGIWLMVTAALCFAVQDAFSRLLAGRYNPWMVVMIRYWIFAGFVLFLALRRPEGWAAVRSRHLGINLLRGALLAAELGLIVLSFTLIGLIETHAVFAICPLIVVALSGLFLGERLTAGRWLAVGLGCLGVLALLQPGAAVFSWASALPLASAAMFAAYSVLTRKAAREDAFFATFFWPPIVGAITVSPLGLAAWQPVSAADWPFLVGYGLLSILSNWLLQKTYATVEASTVQPFAYLQIVFVSIFGILFFAESLEPRIAAGAGIVILAGLYALAQARRA